MSFIKLNFFLVYFLTIRSFPINIKRLLVIVPRLLTYKKP